MIILILFSEVEAISRGSFDSVTTYIIVIVHNEMCSRSQYSTNIVFVLRGKDTLAVQESSTSFFKIKSHLF